MDTTNELEKELKICRVEILKLKADQEELARSLFVVNQKLHDSERLKGHFISNITNEIVNPFTSVLALAQNIKQLKEGDILQAQRMAEMISNEAFHLDFQLRNIFAAALIEAGKADMKRTSFRLDDLCGQLGHYFGSLLNKKDITLSIRYINTLLPDAPIEFISDREKFDLILKNLISNSIKFSPDHSVIELEFILKKGQLTLEVSDQGKGISAADRQIIFDRFKQLDEKINSINTGHGLGLSIVQSYAEMLGGFVSLKDNADRGLQMLVSIPESIETDNWDDLDNFLLDSDERF